MNGRDVVPPAVRARTAVSLGHRGRLLPAGADGSDGLPVGFVELAGTPVLLPPAGAEPPAGPLDLVVACERGTLGVVVVSGSAGRPRPAREWPALGRVLAEHHGCLRAAGIDPAADVVPLAPARVRITDPLACDADGAVPALDVALPWYRTALPDPWLVRGAEVAAHLESEHQAELLALAGAGAPGEAVAVASLEPCGLSLAVLGAEGVRSVRLPLRPPAAAPWHVEERLFGPARP